MVHGTEIVKNLCSKWHTPAYLSSSYLSIALLFPLQILPQSETVTYLLFTHMLMLRSSLECKFHKGNDGVFLAVYSWG